MDYLNIITRGFHLHAYGVSVVSIKVPNTPHSTTRGAYQSGDGNCNSAQGNLDRLAGGVYPFLLLILGINIASKLRFLTQQISSSSDCQSKE